MPPFSIEAVDPNLQPVAAQHLHWRKLADDRYELHQPTATPALDGMGKPTTRLVGVVRYSYCYCMFLCYAQQDPGLQADEPTRLVTSRYYPQLAQEALLAWLTDQKRL